jgi:ubiquinone biosynthesis protein
MAVRETQQVRQVLDALRVEELLPAAWQPYRPLLREGLEYFLCELPAERRLELAVTQASLAPTASIEERLVAMIRVSPTLHKLGQVVARDRRLPAALRLALQRLESLPPSLDSAALEPLLAEAAPELELAGRPEAIAEASVAVVVAYRRRDPEAADAVLKLLKPGIEERLHEDLVVWDGLAQLLAHRAAEMQLPAIGWSEIFDQVRTLLHSEVDFAGEQRNLVDAAAFYRGHDEVEVPTLLPESGQRLTAMTRIAGGQITTLTDTRRRRRAARTMVEALVSAPVLSAAQPVLVHGDPHAGNLFWTPDDRLGLLDWALAGRLDQRSLAQTMSILVAALQLDARGVLRALDALSLNRLDERRIGDTVHEALRRLRRGAVPGLGWLIGLLDQAAMQADARFPDELLLFRKSLLTLTGVIDDLAPGYLVGLDVVGAGLKQLAREVPQRALASPTSRRFATHLSNLDLLGLAFSGPALAGNFWRQTLADVGQRLAKPPAGSRA